MRYMHVLIIMILKYKMQITRLNKMKYCYLIFYFIVFLQKTFFKLLIQSLPCIKLSLLHDVLLFRLFRFLCSSLISFDYSISYFFYLFKVYLIFLLCRFNVTISA